MSTIKVALADDHTLVRNALANLISSYEGYEVVLQADNGRQLTEAITYGPVPDMVLLDINMPVMDGYETCLWLRDHYPDTKVLALSMYDKEYSIIRMLRNGARGYILKDIDPKEFKSALDTFIKTGYYYSGIISNRLVHAINKMDDASETIQSMSRLSDMERELLKLICTEMTYKEIADQMKISPRTVDSYREGLFEKLNVRSRVGLVIYAIRNGIVSLD
jgi:two-component system, NarL family, invasion response regulator UvrY